MLKWLMGRRSPEVPQKDKRRPAPAQRAPARSKPAGPLSPGAAPDSVLPEVVAEGNTQADWSAWEDSMTAWDSQMQDLDASQRVYERDSRHARPQDTDPFAAVANKRGR